MWWGHHVYAKAVFAVSIRTVDLVYGATDVHENQRKSRHTPSMCVYLLCYLHDTAVDKSVQRWTLFMCRCPEIILQVAIYSTGTDRTTNFYQAVVCFE